MCLHSHWVNAIWVHQFGTTVTMRFVTTHQSATFFQFDVGAPVGEYT
jgi:hypothetical protein